LIFTSEDRAAGAPAKELEAARADGRAPDERWHIRKDGTRFWASGVLSAMRNDKGEITGFVKVMRDNTDRKRVDESMERARKSSENARIAAETANEAKDQFLATVSHELRTPLSAIMLWGKIMETGTGGAEKSSEALANILKSADIQKQLIDDL